METPLILVDIDGVANAFQARIPLAGHMRFDKAGRYTVVLDKRHPAWFAELEARAEMCWATMWQAKASHQFAPVCGFGHDWEYVDFDAFQREQGARTGAGVVGYKWPGLMAVIGQNQPVVYIDDDMTSEHHAWAARRNARGIPTLFIQPSPEHGYTRRQHEQVLAFLERVTAMQRMDALDRELAVS